MLLVAIGDAYGAGFEYVNAQLTRQFNILAAYIKHPRHSIDAGRYTDDTHMSIAISEAIMAGDPCHVERSETSHRTIVENQRDASLRSA